jgi:hypothetical protein
MGDQVTTHHACRERAALAAVLGAALAAAVLAPPRGAEAHHKVYSPHVTKGEFALENRGHVTFDDEDSKDDAQRHIFEVEYSVTDWYHTALFADLRKRSGGPLRYDATAWENIFELSEPGKWWVDVGAYLEYKWAEDDDDPDKIEAKLLFEKTLGALRNRFNFTFEEELGSEGDESFKLEYAWQTKWKTGTPIQVGFEAFGELGEIRDIKPLEDQEHQLGPVLWGELEVGERSKIELQLGWLFGLTDATPDGTLKWIVEYEIEF